jgi:hypothetical protein
MEKIRMEGQMKITPDDFRNIGFGVGLLGGTYIWAQVFGSIGFIGIVICCIAGGAVGHVIGSMLLGARESNKKKRAVGARQMTLDEWKKTNSDEGAEK